MVYRIFSEFTPFSDTFIFAYQKLATIVQYQNYWMEYIHNMNGNCGHDLLLCERIKSCIGYNALFSVQFLFFNKRGKN